MLIFTLVPRVLRDQFLPAKIGITASESQVSSIVHFPRDFENVWLLLKLMLSAALNMSANLENSAVATGLEKVSILFQSQRRAMQKNVQTTARLRSSHTLAGCICVRSVVSDSL